jgi:ATP-dependent Clp endopeptidase proteolytic subunit ClpP
MFSYDVDAAEIFVYDEIGPSWWGLIDAQSVMMALSEMKGKHVRVRLNTPGGSVDEGVAIYNALKAHKGGVTTVIDSLAASMGSYIAQAGERRIAASNAMLMIHDPWTIALGNSGELRKTADVLDKYRDRLVPDYAARSGKTVEELQALMADETWYAGQEIVDAGFADELSSSDDIEPVVAGLRHIASKVPQSLVGREMKAGDRTRFPLRSKARDAILHMSVADARAKLKAVMK